MSGDSNAQQKDLRKTEHGEEWTVEIGGCEDGSMSSGQEGVEGSCKALLRSYVHKYLELILIEKRDLKELP